MRSPPEGYQSGKNIPADVVDLAWQMVYDKALVWWDTRRKQSGGIEWLLRVEPHYNEVKKWHRGVTVYQPGSDAPGTGGRRTDDGKKSDPVTQADARAPDEPSVNPWLALGLGVVVGYAAWSAMQASRGGRG